MTKSYTEEINRSHETVGPEGIPVVKAVSDFEVALQKLMTPCNGAANLKCSHDLCAKNTRGCSACNSIVNKMLTSAICTTGVTVVAAAGVCEVALGGPEDPLADLCVATIGTICGIIAGMVVQDNINPVQVCSKLPGGAPAQLQC